jgi:hypothetical protein
MMGWIILRERITKDEHIFRQIPKPDEKPEDFPDVWPNYYVAAAFHHTRHFGEWFILAIITDTVVKLIWPGFWG